MSAGAGNVGYATLQVIPTAKGFAAALAKEIGPELGISSKEESEKYSKSFASGITGKLGGLLKAGGVAAGVALVGGLVTAAGQKDIAADLQAGMGLSPDVSAKFGAAAGLAYKQNYGESVAQVGDTIKTAFQNGIINANDSKDAIAGVVAQIETYSKVSGTDAVESTRAVAQMIKTGLAKNATEAFDLLTRGQQLGINKSEDLLDTFNEYGTQFRKLGIDGPQALGLMNQALKTGARDSDIAADALKEFSIRAIDGSKSTAAGFAAIGLNAKTMSEAIAKGGPSANAALQTTIDHLRDVKDPAARSAAAVQLFGTQAEDLGASLLSFNPRTATESLDGFAGATDKANKALSSTPTAQIQTFTRSLKQGFVEVLGGSVLPAITSAASDFKSKFGPAIADAGAKLKQSLPPLVSLATTVIGQVVPGIAAGVKVLGDFGKFLSQHATTAKVFGAAIALIGAAFVAYNVGVKAVQAGLAVWTAVTKVATAVQWLMNAAFLASPITWIVLGIAAVVAGIVLLATKTQFFQTIWGAVWGVIKTVAGAVAGFFTGTIFPAFKAVLSGISTALSALGAVWSKIWGVFGPVVKAVWNLIKSVINLAIAVVVAVVTTQIKVLLAVWNVIWSGITKAASAAWNAIKSGVTAAWNAISSVTSKVWNAISSAISKVAGAIWGKISGPVNAVKDGISRAFNAAKDAGVKAFNYLLSGVENVVGGIAKKVGGILGTIKNAFGNAGSILKNAGQSIIQGLIDGITSKISALTGKLDQLTNFIRDHKGPIEKDRRLLIPAGQAIMGGLIRGFESQFPAVKASLGGLTNDLGRLPIASASQSSSVGAAGSRSTSGAGVNITVNGQDDPEATARIVGRKLAGAGV